MLRDVKRDQQILTLSELISYFVQLGCQSEINSSCWNSVEIYGSPYKNLSDKPVAANKTSFSRDSPTYVLLVLTIRIIMRLCRACFIQFLLVTSHISSKIFANDFISIIWNCNFCCPEYNPKFAMTFLATY